MAAFRQTGSAGAFGGRIKKKRELLPARRLRLYELLAGAPGLLATPDRMNVLSEFSTGL